MAVEKVLLTKEQVEIVERLKENKADLNFILGTKIYGKETSRKNKKLFELTAAEIATAFLVGYEVELTPEDELLKFYEKYDNTDNYSLGFNNGMYQTLEVLGIKIEGVNK